MGLKDMRFRITETHYEENFFVTTWEPPLELIDKVKKIEMVENENQLIFSAYYDKKDNITRKIYYSEYQKFKNFSLPLRITEIKYLSDGDSTISKMSFSDVKIGNESNSNYFNFKIPVNAKIIKQK